MGVIIAAFEPKVAFVNMRPLPGHGLLLSGCPIAVDIAWGSNRGALCVSAKALGKYGEKPLLRHGNVGESYPPDLTDLILDPTRDSLMPRQIRQ